MNARFASKAPNKNLQVIGTLLRLIGLAQLERALMSLPPLPMLDEPSLGLSPLLIEQMFETVRQIVASGCSVLIAEQNVSSSAAELLDNQTALLGLMGTLASAATPERSTKRRATGYKPDHLS